MRAALLILFGFVILSCNSEREQPEGSVETIRIEQTGEGYNIYTPERELLLEFTRNNTDSSSLETLSYIYQVSREGSTKKGKPVNKDKKQVTSGNLTFQKLEYNYTLLPISKRSK